MPAPDDQSNVGHQQHDKELQKALRRSRLDAVVDDQAEEIGADDAQDAADDGADQPFQAYLAEADFKQHHRRSEEHTDSGGSRAA